MQEKQVESIDQIDFRGIRMPLIAVYKDPKDHKGKIVARVWDVNRPTSIVIIRDTLEEIQEEISKTGMIFLPRRKDDDPVIIGVWI